LLGYEELLVVKDREELTWLEERLELPLNNVLDKEMELLRVKDCRDDLVGGGGKAATSGGGEATGREDLGED